MEYMSNECVETSNETHLNWEIFRQNFFFHFYMCIRSWILIIGNKFKFIAIGIRLISDRIHQPPLLDSSLSLYHTHLHAHTHIRRTPNIRKAAHHIFENNKLSRKSRSLWNRAEERQINCFRVCWLIWIGHTVALFTIKRFYRPAISIAYLRSSCPALRILESKCWTFPPADFNFYFYFCFLFHRSATTSTNAFSRSCAHLPIFIFILLLRFPYYST